MFKVLNIANSSIASTSQQYTDPTTALEFLLSTNDLSYDDKDLNTCIIFDEEGSNDRSTGANMISDTLLKHVSLWSYVAVWNYHFFT